MCMAICLWIAARYVLMMSMYVPSQTIGAFVHMTCFVAEFMLVTIV